MTDIGALFRDGLCGFVELFDDLFPRIGDPLFEIRIGFRDLALQLSKSGGKFRHREVESRKLKFVMRRPLSYTNTRGGPDGNISDNFPLAQNWTSSDGKVRFRFLVRTRT